MTNRVYLLMTVLLGILSFSQSEAGIIASDGAQVGAPPSWSVTTHVKNNLSIVQRMAGNIRNGNLQISDFTKKKESNGESTSGSSKLPKKDTPGTVHVNQDGLGQALKNKK